MALFAHFLRHGGNGALIALALGLICWRMAGGPALPPGWIVVGALLFYASEYLIHRFLFHAPPAPIAFVRWAQHRLHYDHHVEPSRLDLLFLPIWFLAPNLAITAVLVWLILGAGAVAPVMLGVALALLHYEWTHYVAHVAYTPKTAFGRWIKRYHLKHHYVSEKLWFGVSNPTMDMVYGTFREPEGLARSTSVRNLYPDALE